MKLFKELAEVQAKRTIVIAGKAGRDVKEGLNNKLQSVKNWVESEEKKYSAKQGEAKNIIKECTNTYNEIYAIYNGHFQSVFCGNNHIPSDKSPINQPIQL